MVWCHEDSLLLPSVPQVLPKLALLCSGSLLLTCALTGHIAAVLLVRNHQAAGALAACADTAAANAALASPRVAIAALALGLSASASVGWWNCELDARWKRLPAYIGLTFASYIAAARALPASVKV